MPAPGITGNSLEVQGKPLKLKALPFGQYLQRVQQRQNAPHGANSGGIMKKFAFALLAMATALAISPSAKADDIGVTSTSGVTFSASGGVKAGTGVVEGGTNTTGVFLGLVGDAVTLYAWGPSATGEAFSIGSGVTGTTFTIDTIADYDVFGGGHFLAADGTGLIVDDGTDYTVNWTASGDTTDGVTFSYGVNAVTTPEPSSLLFLGTGLLGLAFFAFRKAKTTGASLSL
jgi:PEP-CTERM motif